MIILGISGGLNRGNQDGAAALFIDGHLIFAAEEERFSGKKHAPGTLPLFAVKACLDHAKISMKAVDCLAFAGSTYTDFSVLLRGVFAHHFGHCPQTQLFDHHKCHAAHSFYSSPFSSAAILTADYSGDSKSTVLWKGEGQEIVPLKSYAKPQSLGLFYSAITQWLGFNRDSDEYKVMGLAGWGQPNWDLDEIISVSPGNYQINQDFFDNRIRAGVGDIAKQEPLYTDAWAKILTKRRIPGAEITDDHKDIAASAQKVLTRALWELGKKALEISGAQALCMGGGISLNASAIGHLLTGKLAPSGIYVPAGCSDAGLSIGAALLCGKENGQDPRLALFADCGPDLDMDEIKSLLISGPFVLTSENIEERAACELAQGRVVALCSGRMEFGPRALGQRSILGDPRLISIRDRINRDIKKRELWRPFAPAILSEMKEQYFQLDQPLPYMTAAVPVKRPELLQGITHVDGTSRVQTVDENIQPFRKIIEYFHGMTGIPMILNTSFNLRNAPIVLGPQQAISSFIAGGLDAMILGPYFVKAK